MTMSKSWSLTISSIIIAITMILLPTFGVQGIDESQVQNLVYIALGVSTIGAGNKAVKRISQRNTPTGITGDFIQNPSTDFIQNPSAERFIVDTPANLSYTATRSTPNVSAVSVGFPSQHTEKLTPQLNGTWYKTNMTTDKEHGNVLKYEEPYLYAKIEDTRSYTTAQLWKDGNMIQIEQGGTNETVRLEMFVKVNDVILPMSRGKYELRIFGDRGTSDGTGIGRDEFWIV